MARWIALGSLVLAGLLVVQPVFADDKKDDRPKDDNDFLIKAINGGSFEVKESEMAAKQAKNDKVREFAARMAKDHKNLNDALLEQAKGLKVAVVTGTDPAQRERIATLSKLQGNDFDREYLKNQIECHEKAINWFEAEAKDGKHESLRDFAKTHVAGLKKHLEEAKKIRDDLK